MNLIEQVVNRVNSRTSQFDFELGIAVSHFNNRRLDQDCDVVALPRYLKMALAVAYWLEIEEPANRHEALVESDDFDLYAEHLMAVVLNEVPAEDFTDHLCDVLFNYYKDDIQLAIDTHIAEQEYFRCEQHDFVNYQDIRGV